MSFLITGSSPGGDVSKLFDESWPTSERPSSEW